jgi:hypothetical protein
MRISICKKFTIGVKKEKNRKLKKLSETLRQLYSQTKTKIKENIGSKSYYLMKIIRKKKEHTKSIKKN